MKNVVIAIILGASAVVPGLRAGTNEVPLQQTTEILEILKARYVDREKLDDKTVDTATLAGILKSLGRGAQILTDAQLASNAVAGAAAVTLTNAGQLARAEIIAPDIGYIRISDLIPATVTALDDELKKYAAAKVTGYVLDLRFADGTNYAVAAAVASRFIDGETDLFTVKQATGATEVFRTSPAAQEPPVDLGTAPLMLLVNAQTRGSAEALAGALRAHDRGIVIGSATAGNPVATADVKLADGRWLRLVTAKIALPGGTAPFPNGLLPDVPVKIDRAIEKDVVLNSLTNVTLTASLQPKQKKKAFTEAELVKAFRGEALTPPSLSITNTGATEEKSFSLGNHSEKAAGVETNGISNLATNIPGSAAATTPAREEPESDQVRDTVLQRAVDILKGIRVLYSSQ